MRLPRREQQGKRIITIEKSGGYELTVQIPQARDTLNAVSKHSGRSIVFCLVGSQEGRAWINGHPKQFAELLLKVNLETLDKETQESIKQLSPPKEKLLLDEKPAPLPTFFSRPVSSETTSKSTNEEEKKRKAESQNLNNVKKKWKP
jgi:hypothetical protein